MTGGRAGDRRDQIREAISQQFLGDRVLTSDEVAARTGVSSESAKELWAALGFTEVTDLAPYERRIRQKELDLGLDVNGVRCVMDVALR